MITGVFIRYSDLIIISFFIINEHPTFIVFIVRIVPYLKDEFNYKLKFVTAFFDNSSKMKSFREDPLHP